MRVPNWVHQELVYFTLTFLGEIKVQDALHYVQASGLHALLLHTHSTSFLSPGNLGMNMAECIFPSLLSLIPAAGREELRTDEENSP